MARPKHVAAADLLGAPPGQYPFSHVAQAKAVAEWYGARLDRRQKQHDRLCESAAKVPRADLAHAASTLLLELMEAKELVRLQNRVIQGLREQREQVGPDLAAMAERLQTITDAKKRSSDARHAKNREHKQRALSLYLENPGKFSSKDAAAAAISKVVPVGERAVRRWLHNI
jgi:hypothetical protein